MEKKRGGRNNRQGEKLPMKISKIQMRIDRGTRRVKEFSRGNRPRHLLLGKNQRACPKLRRAAYGTTRKKRKPKDRTTNTGDKASERQRSSPNFKVKFKGEKVGLRAERLAPANSAQGQVDLSATCVSLEERRSLRGGKDLGTRFDKDKRSSSHLTLVQKLHAVGDAHKRVSDEENRWTRTPIDINRDFTHEKGDWLRRGNFGVSAMNLKRKKKNGLRKGVKRRPRKRRYCIKQET